MTVSIEISFRFPQHPFSNRRCQHSSALIGNIHSSSSQRNIGHLRCRSCAAVAAFFTNFRLHLPCVICDNHFLFPRIGSFHIGYLPPQKKTFYPFTTFIWFLPIYLVSFALLCGGFDIHLKIQPKKCFGCDPGDQIISSKRKKGNEYKARVPVQFIRTSTRLEAENYLYIFVNIYI